MKTIETATPKEIADYLQHLLDIAWQESNHTTDDEGDCQVREVWKKLYNIIFSDNVSGKIRRRFGQLDYYDPDASYHRDVTAYVEAFKEFADHYTQDRMFPTIEEYLQ